MNSISKSYPDDINTIIDLFLKCSSLFNAAAPQHINRLGKIIFSYGLALLDKEDLNGDDISVLIRIYESDDLLSLFSYSDVERFENVFLGAADYFSNMYGDLDYSEEFEGESHDL